MRQLIANMTDEVRCGHFVSAKMKQVWNIQLNLAAKLIEVCDKYNLKVWADGGTLLGAVRHQGFIPWDDDMDFVMLREDYDQLQKIAPLEFKEPYFLQSFHTDKYFFEGFSKVRYGNSCMMDEHQNTYPTKMNMGVGIDVFVLDKVPQTEGAMMRLNAEVDRIYNYVRHRSELKYLFLPHRLLATVNEMIRLKKKAFWSNRKILDYTESLLRNCKDDSGNVAHITFCSCSQKHVRPKSMHIETEYLPFETVTLPVMKDYDTILRQYYGDYNKLVKGKSMHTLAVIDTQESYVSHVQSIKVNYWKLYKESWKMVFRKLLRH